MEGASTDWRCMLGRGDWVLAGSIAGSGLSLFTLSQSEATILGESEYCDCSGESMGLSILRRLDSRLGGCRWNERSPEALSEDSSMDEDSRIESMLAFIPPKLSISLRTIVIHDSISSALSITSRKLAASLLARPPCRSLVKRECFGVSLTVPSSLALCKICSTQCFPGIRSEANAAESFPNLRTFSGRRSNGPSPAYCKTCPEVTKMYILLVNCGVVFRMESNRLWLFSSFLGSAAPSKVAERSLWLSMRSRSESACFF